MDFKTLKQLILDADTNGTLITQKHNPDELTTIYTPFRSVVSKYLADNLVSFINSEDYKVDEYQNTDFPLSPLYFTIKPNSGSTFSIPASGVTGTVATSTMDILVVVSGGTIGIHIYGNTTSDITNKISSGKLINKRTLK